MKYVDRVSFYDSVCVDKNLNELKLMGISLWPLIRKDIYQKMLSSEGNTSKVNYSNINITVISRVLISIVFSFFSLLKFVFFQKRVKFLFIGFSRRVEHHGKWLDKFHDPIINVLEKNDCFMLEKPFKGVHRPERITNCNILDYDFVKCLIAILSFPFSKYIECFHKEELILCSNIINDSFSKESLITRKYLSKVISKYMIEVIISKFIFKKLCPEKVILTSRWLHFPFISVANKNEIEVIEIQHGAILRDSLFYKPWDDGEFSVTTMFTFSDFWNNYPWGTKRSFPIGEFSLSDIEKKKKNKYSNNILVISQPELCKVLCKDLKELSSSNPEVNFIVKLHPQDFDGYQYRYKEIISISNIQFIKYLEPDLSLASFKMVLGYKSTMLYEASSMGAKVGLLCREECDESIYKRAFGPAIDSFSFVYVNKKIKLINENNQMIEFFSRFDSSFLKVFFYEKNI